MCVWQSQAPVGTSKFTGVAGWDALAWLLRGRKRTPMASAPTRMARRVSMGYLLFVSSVLISVSTSASPWAPGAAAQGMSHRLARGRAPCWGAPLIILHFCSLLLHPACSSSIDQHVCEPCTHSATTIQHLPLRRVACSLSDH